MRWRAVLYTKNKKGSYELDSLVSAPNRMEVISMISQYAYTMTDDTTTDIKIIIKQGKAGVDNITKGNDNAD
jgi:hypothetical protein